MSSNFTKVIFYSVWSSNLTNSNPPMVTRQIPHKGHQCARCGKLNTNAYSPVCCLPLRIGEVPLSSVHHGALNFKSRQILQEMGPIPRLKEKSILFLRYPLFELIDFPTAITLFSLRICNEFKKSDLKRIKGHLIP